jgi:hypothetical protein
MEADQSVLTTVEVVFIYKIKLSVNHPLVQQRLRKIEFSVKSNPI